MAWSIRVATFCASLAVASCALPPWIGHRPVFPSGGATAWEIPLYEPLTGLGPRVIATVCGTASGGKPRPCEEALLYVDSGSSHSALPAATLARLGVETTGSRLATIEDAAGERRAWSGGLVPEVRFGDVLSLTNVVTVVHDQTAILGGDVLTAHGWRVDLDRGTLVLGALLPPAGAARARLPVRGFHEGTIADLSVQGRTVPLLLDTGAPITVVDVSLLKALGLPLRTLDHGWPLSARDRSLILGEATRADLRLGELDLGQRQVVAYPRATEGPSRGMLGLDVLSDFAFGVTDGALELEPRAPSPLTSAPARVGRWSDLPRCPDGPGCAAAELEPPTAGVGVHVRIRVAATAPRAQRYLFGCVDGGGRLRDLPIWIEIGLRSPTGGQETVVEVPMPEQLRQVWTAGCGGLALLDVNPVLAGVRAMTTDVEARIAIGSRRARLD